MPVPNLYAAWIGILAGMIAGTIQGLFIHKEQWLGGYLSWPRRLIRLAHVSFFGLAAVNLAYVFTVSFLELEDLNPVPSFLLIVGAVTMPIVCYLAAYRKGFRHLFFIPVLSLILGVAIFLFGDLMQ